MDYIKLYDKPNAGAIRSKISTTREMLKSQHSMASNENGIKLLNAVWRDMIMDLFGRRLESTAGSVDYDYDENSIVFSGGGSISTANDRIGGNQEINHEFKVGLAEFRPHLHWWQPDDTAYEFTMRYRLQRNGQEKTTEWTTLTTSSSADNNAFEYTFGVINQITQFPSINATVGYSDTFQIQLARTDSEAGNVSVYFLDLHGQVDRLGTSETYSQGSIV